MKPRALLGALAAALLAGACAARDAGRPVPALVVLVSLDTLRADRLEAYGYARPTAPGLAELAREGVVFRTVVAQASQTLVSHKSLLAGRRPWSLLAERPEAWSALARGGAQDPRALLVEALRSLDGGLVERLRAEGWRTAAFTDGGWMRAEMGFAPGFERYDDAGGGLAAIVPRAADWLARQRDERLFLFVHAYDVHCPYPTREPFDRRFCADHGAHVSLEGRCAKDDLERAALAPADWRAIGDHYDAGIASADAHLGELFAALRARGLWDEALVVVTSDHGESLGEEGRLGHGDLFPEQLLVPLVVKPPASWKVAPRVVGGPLELVDVLPGILEACGVEAGRALDGRSFLPLLWEGRAPRAHAVAQTVFRAAGGGPAEPLAAAVLDGAGGFLASRGTSADGATPAEGEESSAEHRAALAGALARERAQALRATPAGGGAPAPASAPLPPELAEELRRLGYAEGP